MGVEHLLTGRSALRPSLSQPIDPGQQLFEVAAIGGRADVLHCCARPLDALTDDLFEPSRPYFQTAPERIGKTRTAEGTVRICAFSG